MQTGIPLIRVPAMHGFNPFLSWFKGVWLVLSLLLITLIVALYPAGVERIAEYVEKDTLRGLGIGFIAFILLFPLFIIARQKTPTSKVGDECRFPLSPKNSTNQDKTLVLLAV